MARQIIAEKGNFDQKLFRANPRLINMSSKESKRGRERKRERAEPFALFAIQFIKIKARKKFACCSIFKKEEEERKQFINYLQCFYLFIFSLPFFSPLPMPIILFSEYDCTAAVKCIIRAHPSIAISIERDNFVFI